jgi:glycosyltransferase involved in cell wall biosynthesis
MPVTITAIVPNYNHARSLGAAIEALQGQTLPPGQIVIVDDGSSDDSLEVMERIAAGDPRVKIVRHARNQGAIAAINSGLAAAEGDFVLLAAADDVVYPDLLAMLDAAVSEAPGTGLACAEVRLVDEQGTVLGFRPATRPSASTRAFGPEETRDMLARIDNFIMTGAALLDRAKLKALGNLDPALGSFADGYAVRRLALHHGFVFVPEVGAEWRINPRGYSRQTAADVGAATALIETVRERVQDDPFFPRDYVAIFARRWRFGVLRLILGRTKRNDAVLREFAPPPRQLRAAFVTLAKLGRIGRIAGLAWATLAYHPTSLGELFQTILARRLSPRYRAPRG